MAEVPVPAHPDSEVGLIGRWCMALRPGHLRDRALHYHDRGGTLTEVIGSSCYDSLHLYLEAIWPSTKIAGESCIMEVDCSELVRDWPSGKCRFKEISRHESYR